LFFFDLRILITSLWYLQTLLSKEFKRKNWIQIWLKVKKLSFCLPSSPFISEIKS
jgi:hypothetical protein